MKIIDVKKMDDGVSNITIEGRITRVLKPRESQYGWSQFIVIEDDTANMGSNINIENEEAKYQGGEYVKVQGKVSRYVKDGKPNVSLNGHLIDEIVKVENVSQEKQNTQPISQPVKLEKDMDKVWEDKDMRMARGSALKNVADYVVAGLVKLGDRFDYAHEDVDFIYNGLEKTIASEAITKEFGGTVEEKPENSHDNSEKDQKIARARELVRNPHLAEPVNNTMATVKQKKQIYGYINEEGKKMGGMVDSKYITKKEVENIGKADKLTKAQGIKYWDYWYGKEEELGERDKRELAAKEKEGNPFVTERQPIKKRDPKDESSLNKDVLIEKIQSLRKENHLEDDKKFMTELGCNAKFDRWSEKELIKLKEKLEMYKPNWITEK